MGRSIVSQTSQSPGASDGSERLGDLRTPVTAQPAAESLIARIDAALARAGNLDGVVRVVDHLDVLLDLRLAAEEVATLANLDGELRKESRRPWPTMHRVAQRV